MEVTVIGVLGAQVLFTVTARPVELNVVLVPSAVPARTVALIVEVRPGSATPAIVDARRAPSLVAALTS
ncbi:MAG: hypothetical protein M3Q31_10130 [Actinomycetota bacterium]|nr:hypothetical protein [Actinomycetota bacterium]